MEKEILKWFAQLSFIAVVAWVMASLVCAREQPKEQDSGSARRRMKAPGDRWQTGICQGETCAPGQVLASPLVEV